MNNNNNTPARYSVTETAPAQGFVKEGTITAHVVGLTFEDYTEAAAAAKAYAKRTGAAYIAPGMEAPKGPTFVEVAIK